MKTLEPLTYVKLAAALNDKFRPGLNYVFNNKGQLFATDGHRAHWHTGPSTEYSMLIGAPEAYDYPDYDTLFQKPFHDAATISIDTHILKHLQRLAKFIPEPKATPVALTFNTETKYVSVSVKFDNVSVKLTDLLTFEPLGPLPKDPIGINLEYLLDAIALPVQSTRYSCAFTLKRNDDKLGPLWLTHNENYNALIMPMRLE